MTSRLTLLTILLFTFNIHAQDLDTVTMYGRVMDQNAAVLPGAEVHAKLIKTGATRTTTTDVHCVSPAASINSTLSASGS